MGERMGEGRWRKSEEGKYREEKNKGGGGKMEHLRYKGQISGEVDDEDELEERGWRRKWKR